MKSTFSIIFYLKRQVVKKDGTVPNEKTIQLEVWPHGCTSICDKTLLLLCYIYPFSSNLAHWTKKSVFLAICEMMKFSNFAN